MLWINEVPYDITHYPNRESVVRGLDPAQFTGEVRVTWRYDSDADLVELLFVGAHLRDGLSTRRVLHVPYLPYSRLDHVDGPGTVRTLEHVATLINSLEFDEVLIDEPHSARSLELVAHSRAAYPSIDLVERTLALMEGTNNVYLVLPDAGAAARYATRLAHWGLPTLTARKHRDFTSGRIDRLELETPEGWRVVAGRVAIIVDDLCSRGGTFLALGEQLVELGFSTIVLCVTHLEENVHSGTLLDSDSPITRVVTTDAMNPAAHLGHPKITIYPLDK